MSAGAISASRICKCEGATGASQAASGGLGPPGMMLGWPRRPWAPRARSGVSLGSAKGGRALRTLSRRCTHRRLVVEDRCARLAVASIIRTKGAFSRC